MHSEVTKQCSCW